LSTLSTTPTRASDVVAVRVDGARQDGAAGRV